MAIVDRIQAQVRADGIYILRGIGDNPEVQFVDILTDDLVLSFHTAFDQFLTQYASSMYTKIEDTKEQDNYSITVST